MHFILPRKARKLSADVGQEKDDEKEFFLTNARLSMYRVIVCFGFGDGKIKVDRATDSIGRNEHGNNH